MSSSVAVTWWSEISRGAFYGTSPYGGDEVAVVGMGNEVVGVKGRADVVVRGADGSDTAGICHNDDCNAVDSDVSPCEVTDKVVSSAFWK